LKGEFQAVQTKHARRFRLPAALAASTLVLLAAAAFAWPGFLTQRENNTQVRQPTPFTDSASLTKESGPSMKIRVYDTLKDFATSDSVTDIAEFKFVRETGVTPSADGHALYTHYELQAVKVFKGSLKPGDTVKLTVFGGATANSWVEDDFVERFTTKFNYMLFLNAPAQGEDEYRLASPLQGYVPLLGGKVSLNTKIEGNCLFKQGEPFNELSAEIENALK
jgi:hypothetical protein